MENKRTRENIILSRGVLAVPIQNAEISTQLRRDIVLSAVLVDYEMGDVPSYVSGRPATGKKCSDDAVCSTRSHTISTPPKNLKDVQNTMLWRWMMLSGGGAGRGQNPAQRHRLPTIYGKRCLATLCLAVALMTCSLVKCRERKREWGRRERKREKERGSETKELTCGKGGSMFVFM